MRLHASWLMWDYAAVRGLCRVGKLREVCVVRYQRRFVVWKSPLKMRICGVQAWAVGRQFVPGQGVLVSDVNGRGFSCMLLCVVCGFFRFPVVFRLFLRHRFSRLVRSCFSFLALTSPFVVTQPASLARLRNQVCNRSSDML